MALISSSLAGLCFPLGEATKPQVRAKAESMRLSSADRKESQDICFVPDGDYAGFLSREIGRKLRAGASLWTRTGSCWEIILGSSIIPSDSGGALGSARRSGFMSQQRMRRLNRVMLGENAQLYRTALTANCLNWISGPKHRSTDGGEAQKSGTARLRPKHAFTRCRTDG